MYKVVITEDDPMVAAINRQYIAQYPSLKVIAQFTNGADTLRYFEKQNADLLILDVYMPVMNGIQLLHRLRDMHQTVSIIMVTLDFLLTPSRAYEVSGGDLLSKGLQKKTMQKIIDYLSSNKNCLLTSEQVSEATGLSRVTVRRYMNHLLENGQLISDIDYQTGGRPSIQYKYL